MRSPRRLAIAAAALALAAPLIAPGSAAQAFPPIPGDQMQEAVVQGLIDSRAALTIVGGGLECSTSANTFLGIVVRPSAVSSRMVINGSTYPTPTATSRKFWLSIGNVEYVTDTNFAEILDKAGASSETRHVTGRWGKAAARYIEQGDPRTFIQTREYVLDLFFTPPPDWFTNPGVLISKVPLPSGSIRWTASRTTGPNTTEQVSYTILPGGLLQALAYEALANSVVVQSSQCEFADYGATLPLYTPEAAKVAPILEVGPVAWRLHWRPLMVQTGNAVLQEVVAGQKITVKAIRAKAYSVVFAGGLQGDVTITNLANGARMEVSDPLGGVIARCVTLTNGALKAKAC